MIRKVLEQFPEFLEFKARRNEKGEPTGTHSQGDSVSVSGLSPTEAILSIVATQTTPWPHPRVCNSKTNQILVRFGGLGQTWRRSYGQLCGTIPHSGVSAGAYCLGLRKGRI